MDRGHTEKTPRVVKPLTLRCQINKGEDVRVEPVITDEKPSVVVSGGSNTTVASGSLNINLEGAKNNKIIVNVTTNVTSERNSNFVQNLSDTNVNISDTNVNITYNEIRKEIDRVISNESEEIKNIVKEIINEINSKRIPHPNLEKLKSISKEIYDKFSPFALKLMEIVSKTGFFNT